MTGPNNLFHSSFPLTLACGPSPKGSAMFELCLSQKALQCEKIASFQLEYGWTVLLNLGFFKDWSILLTYTL